MQGTSLLLQKKKPDNKVGSPSSHFCAVQACLSISGTHLGEDKRRVVFEVDVARADGADRGGATAEGALAGFLWSGVNSLPASMTGGKVCSRHPAVVPYVEVPRMD